MSFQADCLPGRDVSDRSGSSHNHCGVKAVSANFLVHEETPDIRGAQLTHNRFSRSVKTDNRQQTTV